MKIGQHIKAIQGAAVFSILAFAVAACNGGGGGGGSSTVVATGIAQCVNCQGLVNPEPLLNNVTAETYEQAINFNLTFLVPQGVAEAPQALTFYNGPATMTGVMNVVSVDPAYCSMPVGSYAIQSQQISQFGRGMMVGGAFTAIGPNNFTVFFRLKTAMFLNDNGLVSQNSLDNRASMRLFLDSVNGIPCGSMQTN